MSDASGTATLYYDSMGRITKTDKVVDSTTFTTQMSYDFIGRETSITYPDNDIVSYSYNGPFLDKVYGSATTYARYPSTSFNPTYAYNALGQPGAVTFGNNVTTIYTYSTTTNTDCPQQNFRLCRVTTSTFQNVRYSYDAVGNISGITDAIATGGLHTNQTQTFGYDELNRLTSATGPYGALTYNYDKNGNMLCNSALGSTPTCDPSLQNYASNYTYGNVAHEHAVTAVAGVNYSYDANGNMTGRGTDVLAYDLENRLSSVTVGSAVTSFVYDGAGGRVKKTSGGSTFVYIGKFFECVSPCKPGGVWTGTKHIFAGSARIASKQITTTGDISYYHPDHLGSTAVVTNQSGADAGEFIYFPFGESYPTDNQAVHYKFTGQERDNETSLYFYGARYYDARIGRFISADAVVQSRRNPQFLNRYSYTMNNPVLLVDPSGNVATCGVWGISCGNSQPNDPCGNGNCGSSPPRGSGGNAGDQCPPGGCVGMLGTDIGNSASKRGRGPEAHPTPYVKFRVNNPVINFLRNMAGAGGFAADIGPVDLSMGSLPDPGFTSGAGLDPTTLQFVMAEPAGSGDGGSLDIVVASSSSGGSSSVAWTLVNEAAPGMCEGPFSPCSGAGGGGGGGGTRGGSSGVIRPTFPTPSNPLPEGWEWRGSGPPGSSQGSWYNPQTGQSLHPDLNHAPPIGPHYDYSGPDAPGGLRIFPDGTVEPKR